MGSTRPPWCLCSSATPHPPSSRVAAQFRKPVTLGGYRRDQLSTLSRTRTIGPCVENPRSRYESRPATGFWHLGAAAFDTGPAIGCTHVAAMGPPHRVFEEIVALAISAESTLRIRGIDNRSAHSAVSWAGSWTVRDRLRPIDWGVVSESRHRQPTRGGGVRKRCADQRPARAPAVDHSRSGGPRRVTGMSMGRAQAGPWGH
jgi:hypothetical protein